MESDEPKLDLHVCKNKEHVTYTISALYIEACTDVLKMNWDANRWLDGWTDTWTDITIYDPSGNQQIKKRSDLMANTYKPCMINRILGLKQLWLQVNGHAWFQTSSLLIFRPFTQPFLTRNLKAG